MHLRLLLPLLIGALLPCGALAQDVTSVALADGEEIVLDGRLDDAAWARAEVVTGFFGTQPVEGTTVEAPTEVRVLHDERFLYVGYTCVLAGEDDRVRGYVAAREDVNRDDQVGLYLDPFGDGRRAYIFYVNALGVQQDMITTIDGYWSGAWDARFRSVGHHEPGRYTVEIALPWRSIRFPTDSGRPWRIRFTRRFGASQAKAAWPPYRQNDGPMLTQFGTLHGVAPKRSGIGLELQPSLVARTGLDRGEGGLRWRKPGFPETVDPSLGIKWLAAPSVTLDATINPDFSQVEADPNFIDNNLRFPIFLEERRPFFLEGRELFDSDLLYSRSVVDPLYGIKLSGKVKRVSMAVLHALDETPTSSFMTERSTPGFDDVPQERALAFVSYAGSRLDLGGRSSLGVAFSDKELLVGGQHRADHHGLKLDGIVGLDDVSTARAAIAASETGEVGGDRVRGLKGDLSVGRSERFGAFGLSGTFVTPGYRAENGFQSRADRVVWHGWVDGKFEPALPWLDWVRGGVWMGSALQNLGSGGERDTGQVGGWTGLRLPGLTDVEVQAEGWLPRYLGKDFEGGNVGVTVANRGLDFLDLSVTAKLGDAIRYADATESMVRSVSVTAALRALRRLKLDLSYAASALGSKESGLDVDQVWKARLRIGFTNAFSLRFIAQGSIDENLALNALFEWRPSAGTAVFVGWGHRFLDGSDGLQTQAIDLFLKGTVLIPL